VINWVAAPACSPRACRGRSSSTKASLARPQEEVRQVVFPAVRGGEQTLRKLVHKFRTKGPVYRRTAQTTLRASYTNHYRRWMIELLQVLEFRWNNTAHNIGTARAQCRYWGAGRRQVCTVAGS
jgi:hypothetical protein